MTLMEKSVVGRCINKINFDSVIYLQVILSIDKQAFYFIYFSYSNARRCKVLSALKCITFIIRIVIDSNNIPCLLQAERYDGALKFFL